MAGYREFQTGEVLTAANVNSFLMEQATMTFADAAARDAALAGVLREGLLTYNLDEGRLEVYDGTDWVEPAPPAPPQNLVAVKNVLKTNTFSVSGVGASQSRAVPGLAITHEVADVNNRLIITAWFGVSSSSSRLGDSAIAVHDGTGLLAIGDAAQNRTRAMAGGRIHAPVVDFIHQNIVGTFVHEPGLGEKTYTVHIISGSSSGNLTLHVNRSENDGNDGRGVRGSSGLIIQEVAV